MAILGGILMALGGLASLVFAIWILVLAFQKDIVWGLCSLLIPFVIFVFVYLNWDKTKKPFLYWLGSFAVYVVGMVMAGAGILSSFPTS